MVCRSAGRRPGDARGPRHPRGAAADAGGSARTVRGRRTRQVLHRRRTRGASGTEKLNELSGEPQGVARRRRGRRPARLHRRGQRGRGRPRRHPPAAGRAGPRPRGAVELQGRQVRFVFGGDQRPAAADVHDPDVDLRPRPRRSPSPRCAPSR